MTSRQLSSARSSDAANTPFTPTSTAADTATGRSLLVRVAAGAATAAVLYGAVGLALAAPSSAAAAPTATPAATPATASVRPGASNTGVPAGTTLTQVYGDQVFSTPGQVVSGLDIHGFVKVMADNVTIKNSIIRGRAATASTGLISHLSTGGVNLVVQDTELVPEVPSVFINGFVGQNVTLNRVNIHGTVDGVDMVGANVTVENSFLHGSVQYASDPAQHGGPSHNDGIQMFGSANLQVTNNTIKGFPGSVTQVSQSLGPVNGLTYTGNYLDGGQCSLNFSGTNPSLMSGITLTDNRFGSSQAIHNCAIIANPTVVMTMSTDVWDATNTDVARTRGA